MSATNSNSVVLVVGAGLAGLIAANILQENGKQVRILDKGRSVGGRMATRRMGGGLADHGAQFFTVRTPEFQAYVDRWIDEKIVYLWSMGWSDGSLAAANEDGHPRYAAHGGMNALAKHLAQPLKNVSVDTQVTSIKRNPEGKGWMIRDQGGQTYYASVVLLTPPVPQSLAILDTGEVELSPEDREVLSSIDYLPSLTGMFRISGAMQLPAPGAVQRPHAPIRWIANNRQKGISDETVITVQADGTYSRQLWEADDARVLNALRTDLRVFLPRGVEIIEEQLKRWRYSQPVNPYSAPYLQAKDLPPLFFAGDAFGSARVEGAFTSGTAAAQAIAAL